MSAAVQRSLISVISVTIVDIIHTALCRQWNLAEMRTKLRNKMRYNVVRAEDVLTHLRAQLGRTRVQACHSHTEFDLVFGLESLTSLQSEYLGLTGVEAIVMHVKLPSATFYGGQYQPTVVFQAYDRMSALSQRLQRHEVLGMESTQFTHNKVLHQISKLQEAFFADHWPCQNAIDTLTFLKRLFRHIQTNIPFLGRFCVVCGRRQKQLGLKAVPCNSTACQNSFNEHGLGADLRDIYTRPEVADLLISMASAACKCTSRRDSLFQCIPSHLLQKKCNPPQLSQQINWKRILVTFASLPSVKMMAKQPDLQGFFLCKSMQSEDAVSKFKSLRWILNSCQGHLMQLQGTEKFPEIGTDHQFWLCTDNPSIEAEFARRRNKFGSQYLFHGSPFHNWHCILREGLKNLSGSNMMSHGAAHGNGIYLAEDSSVPAALCGPYRNCLPATSGYSSSLYGANPRCIALPWIVTLLAMRCTATCCLSGSLRETTYVYQMWRSALPSII